MERDEVPAGVKPSPAQIGSVPFNITPAPHTISLPCHEAAQGSLSLGCDWIKVLDSLGEFGEGKI